MPLRILNNVEIMSVRRYMTARRERYFIMTRNGLSEQEKTDLLTLARPECMFWCGKGYDTFHLKHCVKLKGLTHITGFSRDSRMFRRRVCSGNNNSVSNYNGGANYNYPGTDHNNPGANHNNRGPHYYNCHVQRTVHRAV